MKKERKEREKIKSSVSNTKKKKKKERTAGEQGNEMKGQQLIKVESGEKFKKSSSIVITNMKWEMKNRNMKGLTEKANKSAEKSRKQWKLKNLFSSMNKNKEKGNFTMKRKRK